MFLTDPAGDTPQNNKGSRSSTLLHCKCAIPVTGSFSHTSTETGCYTGLLYVCGLAWTSNKAGIQASRPNLTHVCARRCFLDNPQMRLFSYSFPKPPPLLRIRKTFISHHHFRSTTYFSSPSHLNYILPRRSIPYIVVVSVSSSAQCLLEVPSHRSRNLQTLPPKLRRHTFLISRSTTPTSGMSTPTSTISRLTLPSTTDPSISRHLSSVSAYTPCPTIRSLNLTKSSRL